MTKSKELLERTRAVLASLSPHEEKLLRMRYGLGAAEFDENQALRLIDADAAAEDAADDWAARIVEAAAFRHIALSPSCIGCCMWSGGRASCHNCGWRCSARLDDPVAAGHGCFAMMALGTIGLAVQSAISAGAWDLLASLGDLEAVAAAIQIAIEGPEDDT